MVVVVVDCGPLLLVLVFVLVDPAPNGPIIGRYDSNDPPLLPPLPCTETIECCVWFERECPDDEPDDAADAEQPPPPLPVWNNFVWFDTVVNLLLLFTAAAVADNSGSS